VAGKRDALDVKLRALITPAAVRKARGIPNRVYGRIVSATAAQASFAVWPPILGNSVPKSGTHLLLQILRALPHVRYFQGFVASAPSWRHVERPPGDLAGLLDKIAPREVVPGHLFYSPEVEAGLRKRNFLHYLIYRDPRDIVVSEAHYLTHTAKHHTLHNAFADRCQDDDARIALAIRGLPSGEENAVYFPDISKRFGRYRPWIDHADVFALQYEALRSESLTEMVGRMIAFYQARTNYDFDAEVTTAHAIAAIDPKRSHTFRSAQLGQWRTAFSADNRRLFKEIAGPLLIELGYERDLDW
jgi:hypothetical protein